MVCETFQEPLQSVLAALLTTLPSPKGPLLDVGCGTGGKTPLLRSVCTPAVSLVGLDHDRQALREAVHNERILAVAGDAHALPLRPECCGAAVCIAAFGLFHDQRQALREVRRVVRSDGWIVVVTATTAWMPWSPRMRDWMATWYARVGLTTDYWLTMPDPVVDLATLVQETGWNDVRAGAFVLETEAASSQMALPLLTPAAMRQHLTPSDMREYDGIAAQSEPELLPLMLVVMGR